MLNKIMLTAGITSGLVVQNKYQNGLFPSSFSKSDVTTVRPFTSGFDSGVQTVSDPNLINQGKPAVRIPNSVTYKQIFGKGSSADERAYYLEKGLNRIERAALSIPKGSKLQRRYFKQRINQPKEVKDLIEIDAVDYETMNNKYPVFENYRDRLASIGSFPSTQSLVSQGSDMQRDLSEQEVLQGLELGQNMNLIDLAAMDTSPLIPSPPPLPDIVMGPPAPPPPPSIQSRFSPTSSTDFSNRPPSSIASTATMASKGFDEELREAILRRGEKRGGSTDIEEALKKARTDQYLKRKGAPPTNPLEEIRFKIPKIE